MKTTVLVLALLILSTQILSATVECYSTFTNSKGPNAISYCITANGNVLQIQGEGKPQLGAWEGYGITVIDPFTGDNIDFYDYAVSGFGFSAPIIYQPNGANTFPLKITRTYSGTVEVILEQTFRKDGADPSVLFVDMKVTFHKDWPIVKIYLSRSADVVADGDPANTVSSPGSHSVLVSKRNGHGVLLGAPSPTDDFTQSFASDGSCTASHAPEATGVVACVNYNLILPHHFWNRHSCCDADGAFRKVTYQYQLF